MNDTSGLRDTMQRFAVHLLPSGCGLGALLLFVPMMALLPRSWSDSITSFVSNGEFQLIPGVLLGLGVSLLFLGGYLAGWWLTSRLVPWRIAEEYLRGDDGRLTPFHARIAAWFGDKR